MTIRELIEKAGDDLDRDVYFLPAPEAVDYLEVSGAMLVPAAANDMYDESGEPLPVGALVLFPH